MTKPLELTYDQLLALPEVTSAIRYVECSGNGRVFFDEVLGQISYQGGDEGAAKVSLPQWRLGAVGVAEWTGVPLGAILERAGVKPSAVTSCREGWTSPSCAGRCPSPRPRRTTRSWPSP